MKKFNFLLVLTIPALLVSCGKGKDNKGKVEIIDFAKMSEREAKEFFTLKDGKTLRESITMRTSIVPEFPNVYLEYTNTHELTRQGNKYKESFSYVEATIIPCSDAVAYVNAMSGETVTEENVEEVLRTSAEGAGRTLTVENEVYKASITHNEGSEYYEVLSNKPYNEYYSYDSYSEKYYLNRVLDADPFEQTFLSELVEVKNDISYNESKGVYEINIKDTGEDTVINSTSLTIEDKMLTSFFISATEQTGDGFTQEIISGNIVDATENVVFPEVATCEHEYSTSYDQDKSVNDGNYYHYHECNECEDETDIERCTFDENGVCTVCGEEPSEYIDLYESNGFEVYGWYNPVTNKIQNVSCDSTTKSTYLDPYSCEFPSITLKEGYEMSYIRYYNGENSYVFAAACNSSYVYTYYVFINASVTEVDSHYVITAGTVLTYEQGGLAK